MKFTKSATVLGFVAALLAPAATSAQGVTVREEVTVRQWRKDMELFGPRAIIWIDGVAQAMALTWKCPSDATPSELDKYLRSGADPAWSVQLAMLVFLGKSGCKMDLEGLRRAAREAGFQDVTLDALGIKP